jgi:hypothetical protein
MPVAQTKLKPKYGVGRCPLYLKLFERNRPTSRYCSGGCRKAVKGPDTVRVRPEG